MSGSGANTVRLAKLNPLLGSGRKPAGGSLLNPSYLSGAPEPLAITGGVQNGDGSRADRKRRDHHGDAGWGGPDGGAKRRRSRWDRDENDKTFIPGMPTILPTNLDRSQEEAYLIQLQIEDFTRRLRSGDLGIPSNPEQRSPSPEPIYSGDGKRLNTREHRTRRSLEDQRHKLIQKMFELNTEYKPPADYKPPTTKITDKIVIPQEQYPDINFVGLLIGPRGNTLKSLEKESGAKIIIRGKGSVKEGKVGRRDGMPMPGEDEPLHALVSSVSPDCVKRAVDRINEIIRQGVELPEGQNDLRRSQLRELALLNGTLRDQDGPRCTNCGASSHKAWQCPDKPNITNNVICNSCGGAGHISRDCRQRPGGGGGGGSGGASEPGMCGSGGGDRANIDEEYLSLMAELGEGPPPGRADGGGGYGSSGNRAPQYGSTGNKASQFGGGTAPRPLMGPVTGGGGSGQQWTGAPPPLLSQPPPPPAAAGVDVSRRPPPGWAGPPSTQRPPNTQGRAGPPSTQRPPSTQGPPPSVRQPPPAAHQPNFSAAPPAVTLFQTPPPTQTPAAGGGGGGWRAAWQQPPPVPRPLGPPPAVGLPPWQPQFGAPPPPQQQQQQQRRSQSDLGVLTQAGLPNLLATPPPPPPPN